MTDISSSLSSRSSPLLPCVQWFGKLRTFRLCLIPSAQKCLLNVIFWHHISPLTVVPQSFVNELCSRDEERLQIKLWMVRSFHAVVFHFEVDVKLLTCVDAVSARCSIQHVSHTQIRECGHVSSHRSADSHAKGCRFI